MVIQNFKPKVLSLFIILVFILPHSLVSFIVPGLRNQFYLLILALFFILCILYFRTILVKDHSQSLALTILLLVSSFLSIIVKNQINMFDIIFPIMAFVGYQITANKKLDINFTAYLIFPFLYSIYYFNYYAIIPDFFFRPFFNENCFYASSSNSIPIGLNNTLFCFMILNYLNKNKIERFLFYISIINLLLIAIQQSRAGILVAIVLIMICAYLYSPILFRRFRYIYLIASISIFFYILINLVITMGFNEFVTFDQYSILSEKRGQPLLMFYEKLNYSNFFFGFSDKVYFGDFTYTYNVFLDFWNKYNFMSFLVLIFLIFYRIIKSKDYFFPLFFLVPFLMYALVESIYLPMFWDFIIYLILFLPKRS